MIILAVRRRSWSELDSWSFGGGLFWVLFNIFFFSYDWPPVVRNEDIFDRFH